MTDAEKMLQTMLVMGAEAKEQTQTQFNNLGQMMKMAYDGWIKAGFSPKMAFELTKTLLVTSIQGATKK